MKRSGRMESDNEDSVGNTSRQWSKHAEIVDKALPRFAERLKQEKVIYDYDKRPFVIRLFDEWPSVEIIPDLVLHMPNKERVTSYLENYWREVIQYSSFADIGDTWLTLSDYLIEPLSEYLAKGDLIYFVPHASLHCFPMHALRMEDAPLIRKHPVAYSPSASLIRFFQNKGSGKLQSCASFGVVFEEESERVAELFDSKPYNGYICMHAYALTFGDRTSKNNFRL
jgi:hypothetical protein